MKMKKETGLEEIRWQVVKAMIDEHPALREKVKSYVQTHEN
jgi:hypothetical protein